MTLDLTGRRALVTGGGSGIGRAVVAALVEAGADVAVHYAHSSEGAAQAVADAEAAGRRAVAIGADLTDSAQAQRCVEEATAYLGGLDVLVNNAGHLVGRSPVEEMSDEFFRQVIDLNISTAFFVTRAATKALRASGSGRVVNMASLAAENGGGPGSVAYATAKAGMLGFTKGLAKELAGDGVTVNAVAPGFIGETAFHETFTAPEARERIVAGVPLQRAGTPADVAGAVCYLASDLAAYVTGETIDVNGGVLTR
ncbi:3-oxoacyl-ACP reductase [Nocardioides sp. OK12]|uniref:SDR family NAD(P)-dependent oxidoreductase n=1 Tax=Nocardioides sp. OK12 TaxID=2758661 RepID=UPI0021C3083A|nr:3-oxoacyl-ACP reductase family protein [Nocardioides sp. OK12]GHJ57591.1 3-oxoacyl-ACP reductase [Nocardioides sp. OK12]